MATSNFCYENRCIVVTNDDFEFGNTPILGEYRRESLRSYPSYLVNEREFSFHDVVITQGYYKHACIDYVSKTDMYGQDMVTSRMRYTWQYESVKDLIEDLVIEFKMSVYRVRKLIGKLKECVDLCAFVERAFERVNEYLSSLEEVEINKYLDELKERFGYTECKAVAQFSNGETLYRAI